MSPRRLLPIAALVLSGTGAARAEDKQEPVEVVVRGARAGPSARDPTAASTVVRREVLSRPGADAADVLEDVPGVQVTRTGSGADLATASIRGATSAQTPVYLAGIRLNDDLTGTADLSQVPLWMLDRAEIFRGNAPLEADRLGIGGAIFFEPRLPSSSRVGAGGELGSFGERGIWLGGAVKGEGAGSLVAIRRHAADNDFEYEDDGGTALDPTDDRVVRRQNADHESTDAWAIGRFALQPGARLTLITHAFNREQGVTGLSVIPAQAARAEVQRFLTGISARMPCRRGCQLELSSSLITARSRIDDPAAEIGLGADQVASRGQRFVQEARVVQAFDEGFRIRAGLGQELERLSVVSDGEAVLGARRATSRATLGAGKQTGALLVHALGAIECHSTSGPDGSDRCGTFAPSGRVGAALRTGENLTWLVNVGRYLRVPTLGELYGISPAVRGNPQLAAERGLSVDVGTRVAHADSSFALSADAFVFARWVDDLVAFRRSGFGYVRPFNVASARMLGAELAGSLDALEHVRAELALTALDPRDTSPERQVKNDLIPHQSRLVATARSELYTRITHALLDRVAVGGRVNHRSSRVADAAGLIVIADHTTFDADASALFWSERIGLRFAALNLFDARRFDVVGFPLPGRSFHVSGEIWGW